ncbi:MAG: response regulator transcription factor [Synechococcus sp.]
MATTSTAVAAGRLLVVEDDETIRETVGDALTSEGYEVITCGDGRKALELLIRTGAQDVDLVVLDLMLPGMGGLDLCRELRRTNNTTPILVISARDSETDRVLGLEVGADDYLVKPFGIRELVARCRALLRRSRQAPDQQEADAAIHHANLTLFTRECRVTRDDLELTLSPKEFKILELFMRHPKQVWSRDQLLEQVWGADFVGDSKTVDVHIRWLREKIEEEPSTPKLIRTVRGFGYRFG